MYIVLGALQILLRDGFDMRRHALSHLANGELGYSLLTGAAFLLIFSGVASGSTAAVALLALYAIVAWTWIWHSALNVALIEAEETA